MTMTMDDIVAEMAYDDYARDEYESQLINDAIDNLSKENARQYLGTYGDAVMARVSSSRAEAEKLFELGHFGPSLICAVTALELIIRHFLLKPLVQGAFLSDTWAALLTDRVVSGNSRRDRELLPKIMDAWEIDAEMGLMGNGKTVWSMLTSTIWPCRHRFVHEA